MSFQERALTAALSAAQSLRAEAASIAILRSVEATESARWLDDMADQIVTAAGRPELTKMALRLAERSTAKTDRKRKMGATRGAAKLTVTQRKSLLELANPLAPFQDAWWFDSLAKRCVFDWLVEVGLATRHASTVKGRAGYRLTPSGEALARELREAGGSQ